MKINSGPKGLLPWSDAEKSEGQRLASALSPAEVYLSLTSARCIRYEAALSAIAGGLEVDHPCDIARVAIQPTT